MIRSLFLCLRYRAYIQLIWIMQKEAILSLRERGRGKRKTWNASIVYAPYVSFIHIRLNSIWFSIDSFKFNTNRTSILRILYFVFVFTFFFSRVECSLHTPRAHLGLFIRIWVRYGVVDPRLMLVLYQLVKNDFELNMRANLSCVSV